MACARYLQVLHLGVIGMCIVCIRCHQQCFSSHTEQFLCRQHNTLLEPGALLEHYSKISTARGFFAEAPPLSFLLFPRLSATHRYGPQ